MRMWATAWQQSEVRPLPVADLGERYRRYRLSNAQAEEAMARSLVRYGQMAPVVACVRDGRVELLDGFKRRLAASSLPGLKTLSTRVLQVDERLAKAAIFALNSTARPTRELEEAWIVYGLVREDGLTQVDVAELLGRHKSWVCRRLALIERLSGEMREQLRLGLLSLSVARRLTRLHACNQQNVLAAMRRETLTSTETRGLIELLQRAGSPEQEQFVLNKPREALRQAQGIVGPVRDPRLSSNGNHLAKRLASLLQALDHMENWLDYPALYELRRNDREVLLPRLAHLAKQAATLAEHIERILGDHHERANTQ